MKRLLLGVTGWALAALLAGCVSTVDGRYRAGVPLVKDKVEATYARTPLECWTAAKDVLAANGTVVSEDVARSALQANVNERHVWVRVEALDQKHTRVIIQARTKAGGTDRDLAAELKSQVAVRLATGNLTPAAAARPAR